ncbi:hypothetical protein Y032_0454g1741 [Ancylostoma ceylanicum]|uniref:Uncharacterized protein n=1 Tax=Ancylostoma ceylanicum TaxID=53326 RepID=A0A016WZI8_9BILA|nr:hypothetical protein Y032_0454g1741 [Ancylostoma ceylanicum]
MIIRPFAESEWLSDESAGPRYDVRFAHLTFYEVPLALSQAPAEVWLESSDSAGSATCAGAAAVAAIATTAAVRSAHTRRNEQQTREYGLT